MQQLKLSLHENAHDFLEDALTNAVVAEESPKRWKFAILSMVQAIELALKELLADVHPLFVYENVDRATRTVGLDQAVKRLATVANLQWTADESEALRIAKEARDQIVHYEVDANVEQLKLSFSRLLGSSASWLTSTMHISTCHFITMLTEICGQRASPFKHTVRSCMNAQRGASTKISTRMMSWLHARTVVGSL